MKELSDISVYRARTGSGRETYMVTRISAERSLLRETNYGRNIERARRVQINRQDAEIPPQTALLLRKVWLQMLKDPQQTLYNRSSEDVSKDSDAERVVVLDGPSFEWSLQRDSGATLKAELNVALDFSPRAERFAHITAVLLDKYCRARSDARPGIAEMIEAQARQLLAIRN